MSRISFKKETVYKFNGSGVLEEFILIPLDGGHLILTLDRKVVDASYHRSRPFGSYYPSVEEARRAAKRDAVWYVESLADRLRQAKARLETME